MHASRALDQKLIAFQIPYDECKLVHFDSASAMSFSLCVVHLYSPYRPAAVVRDCPLKAE